MKEKTEVAMYKISVPAGNGAMMRYGPESTLKELKRFDAERVFISIGSYERNEEKRAKSFKALKEFTAYFKSNGFEVGAWLWTFMFYSGSPFQHMVSIDGEEYKQQACPRDEEFLKFSTGYVKEVAKCGVDLIMFDDDFRYGFHGVYPACLCPLHLKAISEMTGETITREEVNANIMTGGKNKYRDAYIKANGDAFRRFAKNIRAAADEVNPEVRVGFCTCMSGWDVDGVDAAETARLLAGDKTKPFVRLIGAPYWAAQGSWGHKLADTVEMERMESVWTKSDDIEVMAEGDAFPRPRMNTPASYLENFDTAIRASGCTDGILKYGLDYDSKPGTEQGYAKMHERNRAAYKWIDENFKGVSDGVRIYTAMKKLSDVNMPTKVNYIYNPDFLIFPYASRTLAYCSVPTTFDGKGTYGAVFDENARALPEDVLDDGLLLDIAAAEILTERGFDCGVRAIGESVHAHSEIFADDNEVISVRDALVYDVLFDEKAEVLSYTVHGGKRIPVSVRYENEKKQRFFIINDNPRLSPQQDIMRHYRRSRQYADAARWLSGKKLPAYVYGCPELYIQCKRDEENGALTVGLWNNFADPAIEPVVELDGEYKDFEYFNCTGVYSSGKLKLTDIPPYSFSAFKAKKEK